MRRIEASGMANDSEVAPAPRAPRAHRLLPGDHGKVQLMRILVTGGAGFIGSHYVRTMLTGRYPGYEHAQVTVLDKLKPAPDPIWLVYPPTRHLTPKVRAFVDFMTAQFRAEP